jgi:putative endonuclease
MRARCGCAARVRMASAMEPIEARRHERRQRKLGAVRFGRFGEAVCRWRLRLCGWRMVASGYAFRGGQIDIIARRGRVLAFVEVKSRAADAAFHGPDPAQQRRIARAAQMFLAQRPALAPLFGRFDVMLVRPWPSIRFFWPTHITDAWRV